MLLKTNWHHVLKGQVNSFFFSQYEVTLTAGFQIKFSDFCPIGQVVFEIQFCSPEIVLGLFQK